jgi:uncharacterized protein YndB with AHSA1/START domain
MPETATETRTVVVERDIPHPPQKVWRAVTQGPPIEAWLMKNDFEPVVGHRFSLRSQPMPQWDGVIACEVLAIEPPTRLAYSWTAFGVETVVTMTLTPTPDGTHVRVEQAGFGASQVQNIRGAEWGWKSFTEKLEAVVAGLD